MRERIVEIDFGASTSSIRVRNYEDNKTIEKTPLFVSFDNNNVVPDIAVFY